MPNNLKNRTYTDAERAHYLAVLAAEGGNLASAARVCGIPKKTLAAWRDRPASGTVRASLPVREELLAQTMERLIWRLVRDINKKITPDNLSELKLPALFNGLMGIFDRWRLLRTSPSVPIDAQAGGLDLTALSSDELKQLEALVRKAGGNPADIPQTEPESPIIRIGDDQYDVEPMSAEDILGEPYEEMP